MPRSRPRDPAVVLDADEQGPAAAVREADRRLDQLGVIDLALELQIERLAPSEERIDGTRGFDHRTAFFPGLDSTLGTLGRGGSAERPDVIPGSGATARALSWRSWASWLTLLDQI